MKYRPEIDGLRSLAVIPVILFHAGFEKFSGGFIGVDIFFVISGYLITTIILSEKEKGHFSLINFYERRARRILPALFFVMSASIPFAWFWLFPSDMKDFCQSLVAVSIFSSNLLFWQETGYWGVENESKPLLHTWSLAVEEQYYVLFPLFLIVMWGFRKRWILATLILLALASLIATHWVAQKDPTANFFLLPTRAWELAIGAIIAFYFTYKKQANRTGLSPIIFNEVLGFIGLSLIGYSIFTFNESIPFPSLYALVPTVGAGLIILFSSKDTLVGKLLGSKIPASIGLISYSAYLWHQPLFAFSRHRSLTEPDTSLFIILSVLTFVFAYLSWRYIEKPFRSKTEFSKRSILGLAVAGSVLFIALGLAGYYTEGFESLSQANKVKLDTIKEKWKHNFGLSKTCESSFTLSPECRTSDDPEILIWGDSYAMHLVKGILSSKPNAKLIQMTKSVCGPFFDIAPITSKFPLNWAEGCLEFTSQVRQWIQSNHSLKYAVISSPFTQYLSTENKLLYRNGNIKTANADNAILELTKTLNELKSMGVTPVIFSPPPSNDFDLGRCLAKAVWYNANLDKCDFNINLMSKQRRITYEFLERIHQTHRVIRLDELLCNNGLCKTHFDTTWVFRDKGHLSYEGSAELGKRLDFYKIISGSQ